MKHEDACYKRCQNGNTEGCGSAEQQKYAPDQTSGSNERIHDPAFG